ncbi:hypothetical protein DJICPGNB_10150 [Escherichia coli]|nr:hypothetical protein DJICPGNB_10150 [Escherichia coli]
MKNRRCHNAGMPEAKPYTPVTKLAPFLLILIIPVKKPFMVR